MVDLKKEVHAILVPTAAPLALRIVAHSTSRFFGDAMVVLSAGDLRVRVVRDKGQIFADFGSVADPDNWFGSAVVLDYLGLSSTGGFQSDNVEQSLKGIGSFLRSTSDELVRVFGREGYASRQAELEAVRMRQAKNAWGIRLP